MVNNDISKILPKDVIVYADSAEPKSIEEIRRYRCLYKRVLLKAKDSISFWY